MWALPAYNRGNQGMQHGGCDSRWMSPKTVQRRASPGAGWNNFTGQLSGPNGSVRKLLLLIIIIIIIMIIIMLKGGMYWWKNLKKQPIKDYHDIQAVSPLTQVKKRLVLMSLVFEKSATVPKPNLFRCKNIVNTATFEVRTLNTIARRPKPPALAVEKNIDIIRVQKHRYYQVN